MVFNKHNVRYCIDNDNNCESYKYSYDDGLIDMPIDFLVIKGEYNITYNENTIELSILNDNYKFIYYFESYEG